MRRSTSPATAGLVLALVCVLVVSLSGCTDSPDESEGGSTTPATNTPEPTESSPTGQSSGPTPPTESEPSASSPPTDGSPTGGSTSPTEPAETSSTTSPVDDSGRARARRSLLPARALPGFNDTWVWNRSRTTLGPGERPPGVCMRSSLLAIGGFVEARRDYRYSRSEDASATVLGAVFPDLLTAKTATSVLASWQQRCRAHATRTLGLDDVTVSAVQTTSTNVGDGQHWLVSYGPGPDPETGWFNAEGYVVDGDTLTYVVMVLAGQDYNYEPGNEPIARALVAAGSRLEQTR